MKLVFENGKSLEENVEQSVASFATGLGKFAKASWNVGKATYTGTKKGLSKSLNLDTTDDLKAQIQELKEAIAKIDK